MSTFQRHKPALPWPKGVEIEVPSVPNRAPNAKSLAAALRRIAAGKATAADKPIADSAIGKMISDYAFFRGPLPVPGLPFPTAFAKAAPDESAAHLESLIAALADGDILAALEAVCDVRVAGFMFSEQQRGGQKSAAVQRVGKPSLTAIRAALAKYRSINPKALPAEARNYVAEGLEIPARTVADADRGRPGRPGKHTRTLTRKL